MDKSVKETGQDLFVKAIVDAIKERDELLQRVESLESEVEYLQEQEDYAEKLEEQVEQLEEEIFQLRAQLMEYKKHSDPENTEEYRLLYDSYVEEESKNRVLKNDAELLKEELECLEREHKETLISLAKLAMVHQEYVLLEKLYSELAERNYFDVRILEVTHGGRI